MSGLRSKKSYTEKNVVLYYDSVHQLNIEIEFIIRKYSKIIIKMAYLFISLGQVLNIQKLELHWTQFQFQWLIFNGLFASKIFV